MTTHPADAVQKPSYDDTLAALRRVCAALGEMPHDWPSRDLFLAYSSAMNLIEPDEFNERFRAQAGSRTP